MSDWATQDSQDHTQELLAMAAEGREGETALKVLDLMLDTWRHEVITKLETTLLTDEELRMLSIELRAIKRFRIVSHSRIDKGNYAVKELSKDGK